MYKSFLPNIFHKESDISQRKIMPKLVSGFTLVEMLVYLAIMAIITIVLVQSIVVVVSSNRTSFIESNIRNSGYSAIESIAREIRSSQSIDFSGSVLYPSTAGVLQLNQFDIDGDPITVKFATTSNKTLNLYEGQGTPTLVGPITLDGTRVLKIIFTPIDTGSSQAVRIQLQMEAGVGDKVKSEWFYNTIILRGSY